MKLRFLSALVCLVLLSPIVFAESDGDDGYRVPINGNIDLEAESAGNGKVYLSWSPFDGYKDENFEYYKIVRSHADPNPVYPEADGIGYEDGIGDTRFTDTNAWKSAYYRVCVITDVKGRHCSNVVWVEIEKGDHEDKEEWEHKDEWEEKKKHDAWEKEQEWKEKKEQHKAELAEKRAKEKAEWEAKKAAEKEKWAAHKTEMEAKKEAKKQEWENKKEEHKATRDEKKEDRWTKLYEKLDSWLERFGARLENADMTAAQKIEKIEQIQKRFYAWEEGNEVRMRIVDHLDESLNQWKKEYSQDSDFDDIDGFLEGLLDG